MKIDRLINSINILDGNSKKLRRLLHIAVEAILINYENFDCPYKMAAVGVTKTKEVVIGYPKIKTHPFIEKYHELYHPYSKSVHAEGDLVLKCIEKELAVILVVRIGRRRNNPENFFRLAKPCDSCQHLLADFQPNTNIYYTTSEGTIVKF